jgi:hypothetical protein
VAFLVLGHLDAGGLRVAIATIKSIAASAARSRSQVPSSDDVGADPSPRGACGHACPELLLGEWRWGWRRMLLAAERLLERRGSERNRP